MNAVPPIHKFYVDGLSDVLVLAGPNGVGKTRLVGALIQALQAGGRSQNVRLTIEATCPEERSAWGKDSLKTPDAGDVQKLTQTLQTTRRRANAQSSVLQIESDRSIQQMQPYGFSWVSIDPWDEDIGWDFTFAPLRNRFQDTHNSIFRKVHARREQIADKGEQVLKRGEKQMGLEEFPDPLQPFKAAFSQLLAPKELPDPDPKQQQLYYKYQEQTFPITALSSGEREVLNVVFDTLLRNPSDCIIFFDEPELHLHPELSYKLLQTLRTPGNNQFIFCTHSAEIITASLENTVVFVAPPKTPSENRAIVVREDDATHRALKMLGQSIGIVALGKKLVLIEGLHSSVDKQTYGAILRHRFPGLVLVPSGGKHTLTSFEVLAENVLDRTIWGVHFFMLCDRDAVSTARSVADVEAIGKGRLRTLGRYHLENYFLDETVLAALFQPNGSRSVMASRSPGNQGQAEGNRGVSNFVRSRADRRD